MTSFTIAVSSLRHRRLRTIVTVLSVAIAFGTLVITLAANTRMSRIVEEAEQPPRLTLIPLGGEMPFSYVAKVKRVPGVDGAVEYSRSEGGSDGKAYDFPLLIATNGFLAHLQHTFFAPTKDQFDKWAADRQALLAAGALMQHMNWKDGDTVTFKTTVGQVQAHVIGPVAGSAGDGAFMHFDYVDTVKPGGVSFVEIDCPRDRYASLAQAIEAEFDSSDPPLLVAPVAVYAKGMTRAISAVPSLMEKVGILMALIGLIVTGSTLSMSMQERQSEFGTLRALGFSRLRVFSLVVLQSVITCLVGGLIGCGVPYLLFRDHGLTLGSFALADVTIDPNVATLGLTLSLVLGIVIAILPGLRVTTLDIVRAIEDR